MRLILVKIDEFIKVCDGTRYLALFRAAKFIGVKSGITYVFSHNYVYDSKCYLQVYIDNCPYRIVYDQMIDYFDDNLFETDED